MRFLASVAAAATLATSLIAAEPRAQAQEYLAGPPPPSVFVYHGRRYCFATDGWHGPGWYWCGYAYRVGAGWGGPVGWHGWHWSWGGRGWSPRWGHGPVVFPPGRGRWRLAGWRGHGWRPGGGWAGWHPHTQPRWGGPHGGHPPHGRGPGRHGRGGSHPWHPHGGHPWHPHGGHGGGPHHRR